MSAIRDPDLFVKDTIIFTCPIRPSPSSLPLPSSTEHIIIDNGSSHLRAGFASHSNPYIDEPNVTSKYTSRKSVKTLLFGRDTECEAASRVAQRSPFDGDLLVNFDVLESALDYTFSQLLSSFPSSSSSSSSSLTHPLIFSERLATSLHSRLLTSELLFEAYSAPSVVFGIDSLFAFESYWVREREERAGEGGTSTSGREAISGRNGNGNSTKSKKQQQQQQSQPPRYSQSAAAAGEGKNGLVIDFGNASTRLIPVINGKGVLSRAKRMPWGGSQATELTLKLAQLKYPYFPTKMNASQAKYLFQQTSYFAPQSYHTTLTSLLSPTHLSSQSKIIQFDYPTPEIMEQKTEEEMEAAKERRREVGRKLQEMQARGRAEKALQRDLRLMELKDLLESKESLDSKEWIESLEENNFETEEELRKEIKGIESLVKKSKAKGIEGEEIEDLEIPTFPLADIPNEELDATQIKEKRVQRLMRSNYEARLRSKAEKLVEKERLAEIARKDEEWRQGDLTSWAKALRDEHIMTIDRLKERKKTRAQLTDRKSLVAQNRRRQVAAMATDEPVSKRRKKGDEGEWKGFGVEAIIGWDGSDGGEKYAETDQELYPAIDNFGEDDDDWGIYGEIDGGNDMEGETSDLARIQEVEVKLLQHDPSFSISDTLESQSTRQSALINAFLRSGQTLDIGDLAQSYQLHLGVERLRVPEVWFQPGIAGVDSAGVTEIAGWLLNGFDEEERKSMMKCIYITGGCSKIPNLIHRLQHELTTLLPFQQDLNIVSSWPSHDPQLEAWKGMASWSWTDEAKRAAVTKAEWEEMGGDWLKEHRWSNWRDEE